VESETDNKINFLDITILKGTNNFAFNIYRKPTTTDTIIPRASCHPPEHKHAATRYLINRMNTYDLKDSDKVNEHTIIKQILHNNGYDTSVMTRLNNKKEPTTKQNKNKWAKFTYIGKETKFITKLFKDSNIQVTFTTNNTINKALSIRPNQTRTQSQFKNKAVFTNSHAQIVI
jgi:hypothetical protein